MKRIGNSYLYGSLEAVKYWPIKSEISYCRILKKYIF